METTKINLGEEPKGKKATEKVNVGPAAESYAAPAQDNMEEADEAAPKKKGLGNGAKLAAAGVAGAAIGGGTAMAAGSQHEGETPDTAAGAAQASAPAAPAAHAAPASEPSPEPVPAPAPEPVPGPVPEPTPEPGPQPEPEPAPEPASPHIEEVLVDPDDLDGEKIMNIEGTGTVEIEGVEFNAALVTDSEGNTYYMVDVDGEVNDPNATYDIIVDAETGDMAPLPAELSVSDAQLMADNDIAYNAPMPGDSNNVADEEMLADVYDPSQPVSDVDPLVEPPFEQVEDFELGLGETLV